MILNKLDRTVVCINGRYNDDKSVNPHFGSLQFEGPWIDDNPSYLVVHLALEGESVKYILDYLKNGISQQEYLKNVGFRLGFTNARINKNLNFVIADINFLQMGPRATSNG